MQGVFAFEFLLDSLSVSPERIEMKVILSGKLTGERMGEDELTIALTRH